MIIRVIRRKILKFVIIIRKKSIKMSYINICGHYFRKNGIKNIRVRMLMDMYVVELSYKFVNVMDFEYTYTKSFGMDLVNDIGEIDGLDGESMNIISRIKNNE
jgi:hypothetical protein